MPQGTKYWQSRLYNELGVKPEVMEELPPVVSIKRVPAQQPAEKPAPKRAIAIDAEKNGPAKPAAQPAAKPAPKPVARVIKQTALTEDELNALMRGDAQISSLSKDKVAGLQQLLKDKGYDLGSAGVDGIAGKRTNAAIAAYIADRQQRAPLAPKVDTFVTEVPTGSRQVVTRELLPKNEVVLQAPQSLKRI